ncbi:hypothetical protein O7634_18530 [Micromonospora sp. WMMD1120]|uniref:hypothetical protein n=1 Tax=Micromonospora sp. WMMD1120 TaxID=3016106 RepID=UPI002417B05D|nr:hypothetical protein [Micromonospora sp. WMMD1120]MDG4808746.1 hypothetical protein [Micromonospora sp. WMMD1120]
MGDVRGRLRDDLARHPAPPLGDLVQRSVAQGRRLRRQRRLAQVGVGGSALATLLVIGFAAGPLDIGTKDAGRPGTSTVASPGGLVDTATPAPPEAPAGLPDGFVPGTGEAQGAAPPLSARGTPSTTVIDTVRIGAGPDGELLTATPQGALQLLTRLLPSGKTSGYASLPSGGAGPGTPSVQLYLDRGEGPGMLWLAIHQDRPGQGPAPGTVELTEVPGNCIRDKTVTVHHGDGLRIELTVSTCLAWDGKATSPAPPALSVDEATAIAANPLWGTKLPAELVKIGEKNFASLARSNG